MKTVLRIFAFFISLSAFSNAQSQTMGLFQNTASSFNGYTVYSNYMGDTVYMIGNCGKLIHKWNSHQRTSRNPTAIRPDGKLIREGKISTVFNSGAGLFQMLDWNSNVVWEYAISDSIQCAHHGFRIMPNGNILTSVWEKKTIADQVAAGRNPAITPGVLWIDNIMEIKPIGSDSAEIVWQWSTWDHLIQDFDPSKNNFGIVKDHPELIDINLIPNAVGSWTHVNSVDYNPLLNQILICSRNFCEVLIIDRSTTTTEATTHVGGNAGKGGDLLYRWGNPANYKAGITTDKKLFNQHDGHWIPQGLPHAGEIMTFNNGVARPDGLSYSTVEIIKPPLLPNNTYSLVSQQAYGPDTVSWKYPSLPDTSFFSLVQGSAQMQPNGNVLINEANTGDFQEVDSTGSLVWHYISPVDIISISTQGNIPGDNAVFSMVRYPVDYAGFNGQILTPALPIEVNPLPYNCTIYNVGVAQVNNDETSITVYPNPASDYFTIKISCVKAGGSTINMTDITGRSIFSKEVKVGKGENFQRVDISQYTKGLYLLSVKSDNNILTSKITIQ